MNMRHALILLFFPVWAVYHFALCFYQGLIATRVLLLRYMKETLADFLLAFAVFTVLISIKLVLENAWGIWAIIGLSVMIVFLEGYFNRPSLLEQHRHIKAIQKLREELVALSGQYVQEKQSIFNLRVQKLLQRPIEEQAQTALKIAKLNLCIEKYTKNMSFLKKCMQDEQRLVAQNKSDCTLVKHKQHLAVLNLGLCLLSAMHISMIFLFPVINILYFSIISFLFNVSYFNINKCWPFKVQRSHG